MAKKNKWVEDVEEMLKRQALSSTEISFKLKQKYRYNPHARKVTLVLRGVKSKFVEINKVSVSSSLASDSHNVSLWGLRGYKYDMRYPYSSLGGALDE